MRDAVIFDMDGLLLDTERIAMQTFRETCDITGIPFDPQIYNQCIGSTQKRTVEILERNIPSFPKKEFLECWREAYFTEAIAKPVPLKNGVQPFLNWLKQTGIPCAVATSSQHVNATRKLENAGIISFFSALLTGDQVENSKPHPEIYLKAAAGLGVNPTNCLALEDSNTGVRAAHAANMLVFQIPDLLPPSEEVVRLNIPVHSSMTDVHDLFIG